MIVTGRLRRFTLVTGLGAMTVVLLVTAVASGGNREMVEKSVNELDALNKAAVGKVPDLPAYGTVHLNATITYEGEKSAVKITDHTVVPVSREQRQGSQSLDKGSGMRINKIEYVDKNQVIPQNQSGVGK